jgi:hypothetical protein
VRVNFRDSRLRVDFTFRIGRGVWVGQSQSLHYKTGPAGSQSVSVRMPAWLKLRGITYDIEESRVGGLRGCQMWGVILWQG